MLAAGNPLPVKFNYIVSCVPSTGTKMMKMIGDHPLGTTDVMGIG